MVLIYLIYIAFYDNPGLKHQFYNTYTDTGYKIVLQLVLE